MLKHQAVSSSLQSEQSMCVGVTVVEVMQAREQLFLEKNEIVKLVCLVCTQNLKVSLS